MQDRVLFEFDYAPGEPMPVEKDAKIFEAGDYPDKGITVTEEDLDAIVAGFSEAPVKVEHTDSPLDPLGIVKRIWREGKELFARLAFPADVAGFLERRGVKKLSVALLKDPLRLAEVSLVLSPRVPGAAMFGGMADGQWLMADEPDGMGDGSRFKVRSSRSPDGTEGSRVEVQSSRSGTERTPSTEHPTPTGCAIRNTQYGEEVSEDMSESTTTVDKDKEIAELRSALRSRDVEATLADLKASGKLVPASEPFARAIMLHADQAVTFSEGECPVAELFVRFLEAQPKVIEFSETAPAGQREHAPLPAEDEELLAKLGVTREKVEKYAE